ncbi:hypothetical protein [Pelagicoccus albus]|uniref:Uncharacterized protein n=1 Tax=Pelagicoccus albus TaxID=415222 RepID=A0A7X1B3P4_9BACT|nr:hypothetical protein [Pelagicoccus albus]MBC2605063.1 hypothetical protein [Pelagicoccus albus]
MKPAIGLLAFCSAAGMLGWMLLMPDAVRQEIEARTGFPVQAERLTLNPVGLALEGREVIIGNPAEFGGGKPFMEIESLTAHASLSALGRGEIWIEDMELRVRRATLVVDERGRFNLDGFANSLFAKKGSSEPMPFFAEEVRLIVEELVFVDNSLPLPKSSSIAVRLDQELTDLEDPQELFSPLVDLARRVGSLPVR